MTGFHYGGEVTASYNEARMLPTSGDGQLVLYSNLEILPISSHHTYVDYWGSRVSSFEILTPHKELSLTATSLVEVRPREHPEHSLTWADLAVAAERATEYVEQRKQTKRTDPPVTMTDLVRDTLRLRPDRIIIGEVRDGSALDLLKAWNTGHPGGLATIHANSAAEALTRLEDLIGEVTQRVPYRAIAQAINLVVFIERTPTGRRIRSVTRVLGWDGEAYRLESLDA